jgi:hypothetical protein
VATNTMIQPHRVGGVILNYNSAAETLECLESLRAACNVDCRIWVVDNGSRDGSSDPIKAALEAHETLLELGFNAGYSAGNNAGVRAALIWGADYVLIINPDCRVEPDFLPPLISALEGRKDAGVACPLVLDESTGLVQALGGDHSLWTGSARRRFYHRPVASLDIQACQEVSFPHGACMLVKRECFEDAGLLHEGFFLYYEDVEFGLRVRRKGWKVLAVPQSRVRHEDTTGRRIRDPKVAFYAGRNQVWVERLYANRIQYTSFLGLSAFLRWPTHLVTSLLAGRSAVASATIKGHWQGTFGLCLRHDPGLAAASKGGGGS